MKLPAGTERFTRIKRCSQCRRFKPAVLFSPQKANLDGLRGWCKTCVKAHAKPAIDLGKIHDNGVAWRFANKEYRLERACLMREFKRAQSRIRLGTAEPNDVLVVQSTPRLLTKLRLQYGIRKTSRRGRLAP